MLEELSGTAAAIRHTAKVRRAWPLARPLRMDAWETYRDTLAGRVSDEAWMLTAMTYRVTAQLNQDIEDVHREYARTKSPNAAPPLEDTPSQEELRESFLRIHQTMVVLERELGPKAGVFHYTGYASGEEMWPEGGNPH